VQHNGGSMSPAGLWDPGLSVGSQSELLLGGADTMAGPMLTSSSNGAAVLVQQQQQAVAAGSSHVQTGGLKARQQRRQQQKELKQRQKQQQELAASKHVALHVPQLQHFVCVANYGFLGDVMEMSEKLRWCGPMR